MSTQQFIKEHASTYKLAYFYGVLYSVNALGTAIVASFLNIEWSELSPTTKFIMIILVIQNWSATMLAYLNKTIARIHENKPLFTEQEAKP